MKKIDQTKNEKMNTWKNRKKKIWKHILKTHRMPKGLDNGTDSFREAIGGYLLSWHMERIWNSIYISSMEFPKELQSYKKNKNNRMVSG